MQPTPHRFLKNSEQSVGGRDGLVFLPQHVPAGRIVEQPERDRVRIVRHGLPGGIGEPSLEIDQLGDLCRERADGTDKQTSQGYTDSFHVSSLSGRYRRILTSQKRSPIIPECQYVGTLNPL